MIGTPVSAAADEATSPSSALTSSGAGVEEISGCPPVTVVVATRGRPEMLRRALESILLQDYPGLLEVNVVFDQVPVDTLDDVRERHADRAPVRTLENTRTPGLAGARNTGITAAAGDLVAFCDDDDEWDSTKLTQQIRAWADAPDAVAVAAGIRIQTVGSTHVRIPPRRVSFAGFLESRVTEIHPSGFLLRRSDLLGRVGLVDEALPASYGEDYDLLLRATRHGDVVSVQEPLVTVHWNRSSYFSEKWQGIADGLTYLLDKFPEFASSPKGTARIASQIAFAHAALGNRGEAGRWARSAIRLDRRQLRAWASLAVVSRLAPAPWLVRTVNRRGRGL